MPKDKQETKRTWRVVEFDVDSKQEELAGWLMMQHGANGCEVQPQSGGLVRVRATFENENLPESKEPAISAALDEYGLNSSLASLRIGQIVEEDWLEKWKVGFEPFPVGERLLVTPPWHKEALTVEQTNGRAIIIIEPGLAFGTGFHETTRFCLLALQDYVDTASSIVDIGSGSGILSIAAALLNKSARIVALETDPVACKNAEENYEINGVAGRIEALEASTEALIDKQSGEFDLILANLTTEDHLALLPDYFKLAQPGCHILFAGILNEKADRMAEAIEKQGFKIVRRDAAKMWTGFAAQKPDNML